MRWFMIFVLNSNDALEQSHVKWSQKNEVEKLEVTDFWKEIVHSKVNVVLISTYEYFEKIPIFVKVINNQSFEHEKKLIISKLIFSQTTIDNEMKFCTLVV